MENKKNHPDHSPNQKITALLFVGLGYLYVRVAFELVTHRTQSSDIFYLIGLLVGLHALYIWQHSSSTSVSQTLQYIALTILTVAVVMDAGRLALT